MYVVILRNRLCDFYLVIINSIFVMSQNRADCVISQNRICVYHKKIVLSFDITNLN